MKPTRSPSASATAAYAATGMLDMKRSCEDSPMKTLHACGSQSGATNFVKLSWTNAETAVASAIVAERMMGCTLPNGTAVQRRPREGAKLPTMLFGNLEVAQRDRHVILKFSAAKADLGD